LYQLCEPDAPIVYGILQPGPDVRPDGVPYVRPSEIERGHIVLTDVRHTTREIAAKYVRATVRSGDIVFTIVGTLGATAVVPRELDGGNITQSSCRLRTDGELVRGDYLVAVLGSSCVREQIARFKLGTAVERLNIAHVRAIAVPLPPLAEQHRIVVKVYELMKLCDELEAAQKGREERRNRLAAASLARLNQPTDDVSEFRENARFHLRNLPRLVTKPEHIKQLRQTILNLAVRGKLVPQDSNDERAEAALRASDDIRRKTALSDRRADAKPQDLIHEDGRWPVAASWVWRGVADLVLFIDYRGKTPVKTDNGVRLVTAKNVRRGFISETPEEFIADSSYASWMTRGLPRYGDVLFTTEAPMGNAAVVRLRERFALAQRVICFRGYGALVPEFLSLQLLSPPFQAVLDEASTGLTAKGIKAAKLKRLPIVVPPNQEQHRIVAKVEELLALCDQLDAHLAAKEASSQRLLEAVLHEALEEAA
jgi:type I restriction enzyme S subunit